ncbi:delta endotoxin C-terminal domain-containing protein [Bacillus cereus]
MYGIKQNIHNSHIRQDEVRLPKRKTSLTTTAHNNYSHRLSYIAKVEKLANNKHSVAYNYSLGWTHYSVDPKNTIAKYKITQIPAVKASVNNKDIYVLEGPGHTGGDLVQLSGLSEDGLEIRCFVANTRNYKIRLRYATNTDTTLKITVKDTGTTTSYLEVKKSYDGDIEKYKEYGNFDYVNCDHIVEGRKGKYVNITIQNDLQDTFILLDKIEFIPLED